MGVVGRAMKISNIIFKSKHHLQQYGNEQMNVDKHMEHEWQESTKMPRHVKAPGLPNGNCHH